MLRVKASAGLGGLADAHPTRGVVVDGEPNHDFGAVLRIVFPDSGFVRPALTGVDDLGETAVLDGARETPPCRTTIACGGQQAVDRLALFIHGTIPVAIFPADHVVNGLQVLFASLRLEDQPWRQRWRLIANPRGLTFVRPAVAPRHRSYRSRRDASVSRNIGSFSSIEKRRRLPFPFRSARSTGCPAAERQRTLTLIGDGATPNWDA
jgi:hypothetical protein